MGIYKKNIKIDSVYLTEVENYRGVGKVKQRFIRYRNKEVEGEGYKKYKYWRYLSKFLQKIFKLLFTQLYGSKYWNKI